VPWQHGDSTIPRPRRVAGAELEGHLDARHLAQVELGQRRDGAPSDRQGSDEIAHSRQRNME